MKGPALASAPAIKRLRHLITHYDVSASLVKVYIKKTHMEGKERFPGTDERPQASYEITACCWEMVCFCSGVLKMSSFTLHSSLI